MPVPTLPPEPPVLSQPAHPLLDAFEATLRRHQSATLALEEWCAERGFAQPARVTAQVVEGAAPPPPAGLAEALGIGPQDSFALRNVQLSCGEAVLSIAWNWYVPARLTLAMNETLRTTREPFGKVVAPLGFRREALEVVRGRAENCPAGTISTHRARLILPDGRPLAYLVECYTAANLSPPPK